MHGDEGGGAQRHHLLEVVVRFADLDALGHLNNVALITMLETGRVELANDLGMMRGARPTFVLASLQVEYRAQAFYRDALELDSRVSRVGRTSFTLQQRLRRPADGVTVAEATSALVLVGDDGRTPVPIDGGLRRRMTAGGA